MGWLWLPVAMALLIILVVFLPPSIGLAANGDFEKVSRYYRFMETADNHFRFMTLQYPVDPNGLWRSGFVSSEHVPVWIATRLSHGHVFDIRWVGAVHAFLFLLAVLIAAPALDWRVGLAGLLIVGDVANLVYFNTFYMEAAAIVFLLIAVACWFRGWCWLAAIAATLMILSKTQHALLALPIAMLLLTRRKWAASVLPLAAMIYSFQGAPPDYAAPAVFNMIFYEILPLSDDPKRDLREFNLDESYLKYRGMNSFSDGAPIHEPEVNRAFRQKTTYGTLLFFYVRHPFVAIRTFERAMGIAGIVRPTMGNYDPSSGKAAFSMSHSFGLWSSVKKKVFENRGWLLIAAAAVLSWFARKHWALVAMMWLVAGIGSLADCLEVVRHLYLFHLLFDLVVLTLVAGWVSRARLAHD